MSRLIFIFGLLCMLLALASRHSHHVSAFHLLFGVAVVCVVLGLLSLRHDPVTQFLQEIRRLAD